MVNVKPTMPVNEAQPTGPVSDCPVCSSSRLYYLFSVQDRRVVCCNDCGVLVSNREPTASTGNVRPGQPLDWNAIATRVAQGHSDAKRGVLYFGPWFEESAAHAPQDWQLESATLVNAELVTLPQADRQYDVVVLDQALNHATDPRGVLDQARLRLKANGTLVVTTPSLAAWSNLEPNGDAVPAVPFGIFYLNATALQSLLFQNYFREIEVIRATPSAGDNEACMIVARPAPLRTRPILSVIVPVFNEAATASLVLDKLLKKTLRQLDIEIVIVESNSTDGSRDVVQKFADRDRVRLILEEKPRGKGHAVRAGLHHATGDFILIQDADLEYDLEDYDALLEPLVTGRRAFVLGARHGGSSWKIRKFSDQPLQALLLNLAHHLFTLLINVSLGLRLADPFTMFKVFRRDCLHGLRLECNRFDFDWELLIKLVRKGYRPLEIPVNYRSRSFKEGKKIRIFRDPLTWIVAWAKARFGSLA